MKGSNKRFDTTQDCRKTPLYALRVMIRELTLADERFLAQITAASTRLNLRTRFVADNSISARFPSRVLIYSRKRH